jgi:general secretion pathway protein B
VSFILDALRKSELERQRQTGPGFVELRPVTTRSGFPVWAVALGALLAINLVVLVFFMLRRDHATAEPSAPSTASTPTLEAPAVAQGPATFAAPAAAAPLPDEMPVAEPYTSANALANAERQARATPDDFGGSMEESTGAATGEAEPELQPPPRGTVDGDGDSQLPTLSEVALQDAGLPDLHLDIHVYAAQPADRFVFLNNRKYREGGETPEGTKIERITRDGVVLNHRGARFLLPRQ